VLIVRYKGVPIADVDQRVDWSSLDRAEAMREQAPMTDHLTTRLADGVLTLALDRPAKKNALTDAMYGALADGLGRAEGDEAIRVVVIASSSDAFTAGNDLGEFATQAAGAGPAERQVGRFLAALVNASVPIVAGVSGLAVGVGATMLLHCDLVLMAEHATLATPFIDLALVPEAASSVLLPQRIGHALAFEMFALGRRLTAAEALTHGLANRVLPAGELDAAVAEMARALAERPVAALRITKQLMRDPARLHHVMDQEGAHFAAQLRSHEARARFAAFAARGRG